MATHIKNLYFHKLFLCLSALIKAVQMSDSSCIDRKGHLLIIDDEKTKTRMWSAALSHE